MKIVRTLSKSGILSIDTNQEGEKSITFSHSHGNDFLNRPPELKVGSRMER